MSDSETCCRCAENGQWQVRVCFFALYGVDHLRHGHSVTHNRSYTGRCEIHWHKLAAEKWPEHTLRLQPFYATYKVGVCSSGPRSGTRGGVEPLKSGPVPYAGSAQG